MAIVYLCPSVPHPVGGIKVLYRHVEMLRSMGEEAYVWHPDAPPDFRCAWLETSAPMRPAGPVDPEREFIVIPEVWAATAGQRCLRWGVRYAVFVQNGFYIPWGKGKGTAEDLCLVYEQAPLVLSISEDTTRLIRAACPRLPESRILRMLPHMPDAFAPRSKHPQIAYMPRKLRLQSELLVHCLEQSLPRNWSMVPIEEKSEHEVGEILGASSVFLSLCDLEGFGLPPLEAALSGNLVVGYTGQAAKEYFERPVFRTVEYADVPAFVSEVLQAVRDVEAGWLQAPEVVEQARALRRAYGSEAEQARLQRFAQRVAGLLAGAAVPAACA